MTTSKIGWLHQHCFSNHATQPRRDRTSQPEPSFVQQGAIDSGADPSLQVLAARLTPLDDQGIAGSTTEVELKSYDHRGISFHHQLPLSARRALLTVDEEEFGSWEAVINLSWCRFNRMGHYTSGGRFVQPVDAIA